MAAARLYREPDDLIKLEGLARTFRTGDANFVWPLVNQLAAASGGSERDELPFVFAVISDIKPKDHIERMLAAQMATVHFTMLRFTRQIATSNVLQVQDSAVRAFNNLARTFASQMEALKRYRTGGEQKVTVHHVSVTKGSQAIVGNVTQAPADPALDSANHPAALPRPQNGAANSIFKMTDREPAPIERRQTDDEQSSA